MYRVMIIDDERSLRNLLKKAINWEKLSLNVVGEAASGIEAINIIDEIKPDIAFVDIKMPFMNGIEFSKIAINRYKELKIIVLTAFDEFSYARECIGIGVSDYLLKPISRKDVISSLKKIVEELNEKQQNRDDYYDGDMSNGIKIKKVQAYIEKNYKDAELNLTSVANYFGFNASYFSRKFKEETGKSFIDFLTTYRIEKACQYAKQGNLMYITANLVGIPDPNYFGKCFKRYKHVTYTDYTKEEKIIKENKYFT